MRCGERYEENKQCCTVYDLIHVVCLYSVIIVHPFRLVIIITVIMVCVCVCR